jgi:hypothetical protein
VVLERNLVYLFGREGLKASFQPSCSNFALLAQSGAASGEGSWTNSGPTTAQTNMRTGLPWGTVTFSRQIVREKRCLASKFVEINSE